MVGTHIFSRYCVRYVTEILFSKGIFSVDYQKLLNYYTSVSRKISSIRSHSFTLDCLMSHKTDHLKSLLDVQRHMIKNQYLMLLSCMFDGKIIVLMCSVHCRLHFSTLVIKFLLIILKMKLHPFLRQMSALNLIKIWR